ncbi:MAG: tripartite tricarboxylate transporter permease, partial [Sphaerochaetaceae bacterium]
MKVAIQFGPMEFFALGLFGISLVASLSNKSILKGILAGVLGLIIATVGIDPLTGHVRYTFGSYYLLEGISLMPALVGLYALSEVIFMFETQTKNEKSKKISSNQFITFKEFKDMLPVIFSGSFIGAGTGIIPGAGGSIGGWLSYQQAKRFAKDRDQYGQGALSGVAASESANNAVVGGALIPLLALGIPGSPTTAVLLGALMLHGVSPGPDIMTNDAPLFYGIVIGLFVTCIVMFFIGNLLRNFWVKMINIPSRIIAPIVLCISIIGAFSVRNLMFDVFVAVGFGILGYFMRKFDYPLAPTVLALVLGKMMESNLRRSLLISNGDWGIFLTKPISVIFLILAFISFFSPIIRNYLESRKMRSNI